MILELTRLTDDLNQTVGSLILKNERHKQLFSFATLEPSWLGNETEISCIPCGFYAVKKRYSLRYGWHFHIQNVPDRSLILIHHGNYRSNTRGCILVGTVTKDINKDGFIDVANSRLAMNLLLKMCPSVFTLKIENSVTIWK